MSTEIRQTKRKRKRNVTRRLYRFVFPRESLTRYNVTSSHKHQYAWFRVPKTGTRSLLKILEEHTDPEINGYRFSYEPIMFKEYFKFSFIRNPWARVVSCYENKVIRKIMFEECWDKDFTYFVNHVMKFDPVLCNIHIQIQSSLFPMKHLDHLAKFERYKNEFDYIVNQKLGLNVSPPHLNKTRVVDYRSYYNDSTRKMISKFYHKDIELGEYTFDNGFQSEVSH